MVNNSQVFQLMIQGTASNVGKSIITTALCRIFARRGFRTYPFKSWNMALNSAITAEGGEIGIAQIIQAEAAGVEPRAAMQPLLLKPNGDGTSQIVAEGSPVAREYFEQESLDYKKWAMQIIKKSLKKIRSEADIVIIEGAGSPAEVNIKENDLANMSVARLYNTPVLLVADIDRGGALASLVGTVRLLPEAEKNLIEGFIINRFRGDRALLEPALEFLENYTGIPVLAVLPYIKNIKLPEEDSVSLDNKSGGNKKSLIKIAVIKLPHISNFTDFDSLELEPDVELNYISDVSELSTDHDLLIIPGTKQTIPDLLFLKKSGFEAKIKELAKNDFPIIGICGGYQMMGKNLINPHKTEGNIKEMTGLDILAIETVFLPGKTTHQVEAEITGNGELIKDLKGNKVKGYEIHMGKTVYLEETEIPFKLFKRSKEEINFNDGAMSNNGLIFGTYLHGLFNNDAFRRNIINILRRKKGLKTFEEGPYSYQNKIKADFDKLADIVEGALDIDYLINDILKREEE